MSAGGSSCISPRSPARSRRRCGSCAAGAAARSCKRPRRAAAPAPVDIVTVVDDQLDAGR